MPTFLTPAPTGPTTGAQLIALVETLINWFFVGFMLLSVVFVLFAALQYISSGGDPNGVKSARNKLFWAAIAIAVALLSKGFVFAIGSILGV